MNKNTKKVLATVVERALALSSPTRVEILYHITKGCSSVEEIHEAMGRGVRHATYTHIHHLAAIGLVDVERAPPGTRVPLVITPAVSTKGGIPAMAATLFGA